MKDYERHVQNVIASDSMDLEVGQTIQYLVKFLAAANVDYIVVGSAALQSYLEYCQQLPRDLDVALS